MVNKFRLILDLKLQTFKKANITKTWLFITSEIAMIINNVMSVFLCLTVLVCLTNWVNLTVWLCVTSWLSLTDHLDLTHMLTMRSNNNK